jgi:hypothetical protein
MAIFRKIGIYKASELKGKACYKKILERGRKIQGEMLDTDEVTERMQEYLAEKFGIVAESMSWSLGHCQGDGVAFYGHLHLEKLAAKDSIVKRILSSLTKMDVTIHVELKKINSRYDHWNSMGVEMESDQGYRWSDRFYILGEEVLKKLDQREDKLLTELQEYIESLIKTASRDLENVGYELVDAGYEDDEVVEMLDANGYQFLSDGTMVDADNLE